MRVNGEWVILSANAKRSARETLAARSESRPTLEHAGNAHAVYRYGSGGDP